MHFNKFVMIWYEFAGVQSMLYFNFHHCTFQPAVQEDFPLPIAQSPWHFPIWEIEYVHVNMYPKEEQPTRRENPRAYLSVQVDTSVSLSPGMTHPPCVLVPGPPVTEPPRQLARATRTQATHQAFPVAAG